MFCKNCGSQLDDRAVICPHCGVPTDNYYANGNNRNCGNGYGGPAADDAPSAGFAVLGFFFPIVGLILYLVWQQTYPLRARSAGKGALISVIVSVSLSVVIVIIAFCVAGFAYAAGNVYY